MIPRTFPGWIRLFLLLGFLMVCLPVVDASQGQTVRIGFPRILQSADNRNLAGLQTYALTYLDELSRQTDWSYEFYAVPYEECWQMLANGELDFIFPVENGEKLGDGYISTDGYACYTLLSLYVRKGDDRFPGGAEPAMGQRVIGLLENENHQKQFQYYQKKNRWELTTRIYPNRKALTEALRRGEVDAIVDNGNRDMTDGRLLASFAPLEACFVTTLDKQALADEFNLAIHTSQVTNPDFETWLEEQFLDPVMHRIASYTEPERDLIQRMLPLKVAFVRDLPPLAEGDEQDGVRGIYTDILRQMAKDSGLTLDFAEAASLEEVAQWIDQGIVDMALTVYDRDSFRQGLFFTNTFRFEPMAAIARRGDDVDLDAPLRVVIPEWMPGAKAYIQRRYRNLDIREYSDADACLDLVSRKECDLAMIPQAVLQFDDTLLTYPSLEFLTSPELRVELPVCLAVSRSQPRLLQEIFDKSILHLNAEIVNQIIQQNLSQGRISLRFILSRYPLLSVGVALFFITGGIVTAFFAYLARMKNRQAQILDDKNRELQMTMRARDHAQHDAETDPLTGLLNRMVMETVCRNFLVEASEGGTTFAFFIVDLDHFKKVNDTYGHQVGDDILKGFAKAVANVFRRTDCIGRFGGDEFVIFAPFVTQRAELERLSNGILEAARNLMLEDGSHPVSASIGIALAPEHGRTYDEVFQAADTALYQIKEQGRNGFRIYEPGMGSRK